MHVDSRINVEEGDIKGTTTKIKDEHRPSCVADWHLLKTICKGSGGWLIDNAQDI
jgi:hypothetical protein